MANKAISELPQAQNVNNQDLFVLEQSGIAKKLTAETFITEQGIIDALAEALDGHGGIQSVTLSSVSGRIRTYRITFTDQSATTFQVYDGTSIDRISRTSSSGLDDVYTIFLSDGTTTFFTVHNGADGNVSEAMLNDALKDKAPAVTETTESSAIANFTDGADDMPLHNILAEINPVQDLTYGDPYPAGGGKNLLPPRENYSANGITATWNADGSVTFSGTATANAVMTIPFTLPANTTVTFSAHNTSAIGSGVRFMLIGGDEKQVYLNSANVEITWTPTADVTSARFIVSNGYSASGTVYPQIELGSTASSFAPYSNICPISGWTGVNVTRTGKNLYNRKDSEYNVPVYSTDGTANSYPDVGVVYVPVLPNTKYSVTLQPNSRSYYFRWIECDKNKGFVFRASGTYSCNSDDSRVVYFTTRSNTAYLQVAVNQYGSGDIQRNNWEIQIEKGDATTYEPYQGNTVTLSWQTEAGTVYGGTIDVATGLLTVDRTITSFNGSETWYKDNYIYATGYAGNTALQGACSHFPYVTSNIYNANGVGIASWGFIVGSIIAANYTLDEWKSFLQTQANNGTPVTVAYGIGTPQTYQLTPQEVIKTLLGTNNVWTDTGDTSVTYTADTKMFIEKLTMPTEDDMVANQAITSGKYFMVGNSLYLALANIASGAQITIGTNAQRVSLADALNTINS